MKDKMFEIHNLPQIKMIKSIATLSDLSPSKYFSEIRIIKLIASFCNYIGKCVYQAIIK